MSRVASRIVCTYIVYVGKKLRRNSLRNDICTLILRRINHFATQTMNANDLRAELGIKMLELEKAIDLGMPYSDLKNVYSEIKKLQYDLITVCCEETVKNDGNLVIE